MPRKQSKAVPEGNGPVLHHDEFGSDESMMADIYRLLEEILDRINKNVFDRMMTRQARKKVEGSCYGGDESDKQAATDNLFPTNIVTF